MFTFTLLSTLFNLAFFGSLVHIHIIMLGDITNMHDSAPYLIKGVVVHWSWMSFYICVSKLCKINFTC